MMHVSRKWLQWQSNQQGVQNKAKPSSLKLKFNECEPSSPFIIIQEYACLSVCVSDEAANLFQNIKRYRASAISTTPARDLDLLGPIYRDVSRPAERVRYMASQYIGNITTISVPAFVPNTWNGFISCYWNLERASIIYFLAIFIP